MARISCSNITKSYGAQQVVHGFDLDIEDHEFVVFLGPSGCGKSTILRMIAGLENITGGDIRIDDRIVNELAPRDRNVAMVFQNYALYPHMSVAGNIAFGLKRMKVPAAEIAVRTEEVVTMLGLQPYLDRKPSQLSGGQQQRVAIARAMIKTPQVFLFDEPLSNLDAKLRNHMRVEIARLHQRLKTTSVYVTHDQLEAMTLADRIVLLNAGRIEQIGTPAEIYQNPKTLFVASFIGTPAMNLIAGEVKSTERSTATVVFFGGEAQIDAARFRLSAGVKIVIGVRPTDLVPVKGKKGAIGGTANLVEFHGNDVLVTFPVGDGEISALVPTEVAPKLGVPVSYNFKSNAVHLFDQETGNSLKL
jgi:multiple sugar transport system ATP-binding protein